MVDIFAMTILEFILQIHIWNTIKIIVQCIYENYMGNLKQIATKDF